MIDSDLMNSIQEELKAGDEKPVAFGFFEDQYPSFVSIEDAKSEILQPVTLSVLISAANKMSEILSKKSSTEPYGEHISDDVAKAYQLAAVIRHHDEGSVEVDDGACVSQGDDDGAYVSAWVWVTDEESGICSECGCIKNTNKKCGHCQEPEEAKIWKPESIWSDHPDHSFNDWAREVGENETRLSYKDWVNSKIIAEYEDG